LERFPVTASQIPKKSTIDIWWVIHDGGLLILLSWLLQQHRIWRKCTLRLFTIMENVTEEVRLQAEAKIRETLRKKQLFDAHVKAIVIEDEMIEPYTYDWTLRASDREQLLAKVKSKAGGAAAGSNMMPMELDELFREDDDEDRESAENDDTDGHTKFRQRGMSKNLVHPTLSSRAETWTSAPAGNSEGIEMLSQNPDTNSRKAAMARDGLLARAITGDSGIRGGKGGSKAAPSWENVEGFSKLNQVIVGESQAAQLVVINLPDVWGTRQDDCERFMSYCDTLTNGLERVVFVHSTGTEMFTM
jgi:potassium/chloride transporter 4/5/6